MVGRPLLYQRDPVGALPLGSRPVLAADTALKRDPAPAVESRRGHHRNWTGRSGQDTPERPPPGELVDASLRAGRECDPADDQVPEEFARLGDLAPQHRPPVGQPVADLALQT